MFHPRRLRTLFVVSACATLALLLLTHPHAKSARVAAQSAQAVPPGPGLAYTQTNLVSDVPGLAQFLDPLVVNTWGVTPADFSNFPAFVNMGTNTAIHYDIESAIRTTNPFFLLTIPGAPPIAAAINASGNSFPSVSNNFLLTNGTATGPATVVFVSPAGEITAWGPVLGNSMRTAKLVLSAPGHMYTGVAIADDPLHATAPGRYLYAADFAHRKIDVYNDSFVLQTTGFNFTDPTIPPDYNPYNIQAIDGLLYVAYAKPGPGGVPLKGPGLGFVRVFNADSVLVPGGFSGGEMNAPWGMTIVHGNFGIASHHLLVANTGDGRIISEGQGPLLDASGNPIVIEGLHGLATEVPQAHFNRPLALVFTAGVGNEGHGLFGRLRATTTAATSIIQFATENFAVDEAGGHVDFTVVRNGDTSRAATVNYNTFDASGAGRASQKSDYEISLGTLTFAPGETSKTFRILVVNDNLVEGDEKISLALSNVTGPDVGFGGPDVGIGADAATLTILDNDVAPSTSNPTDGTTFFVRQHYLDFLNREPDTAGFNFWVNQITACGSDAQCVEVRRINVSAAFFLSIEFRNTGLLAYLTNKAAFGPSALGSPAPVLYGQFMHDVQQLQKDFVFGSPGADAVLESNKQAYFAYTVARPDFAIHFSSQTPAQYVDSLFANAGVTPTNVERDAAIAEFGGAADASDQAARARALRRVAENAAFANAEFTRAFVTMEYFGYLRRDPDAPGFNFWLSKLNQFNGDFQKAEMVKAFISSGEYRQRFGAN